MNTNRDPLIGHRLADKYEITGVLGRGGFGTVYVAIQPPIGRRVAVKLIRPEHVRSADVRRRFLREAHAVAALSHPSIVTLFDYGVEADGRVYMVLEYIDGDELWRLMQREGPMQPVRVVALGRQALAGLAEAHRIGLVHRDLKPANIMVVTDSLGGEQLKILDFGIAKLLGGESDAQTREGVALGTPRYMSPEQAVARDIGPWSDQYALAVVFYEMLTGQPPFDADSQLELLNHHIEAIPPPFATALSIPAALEAVIARGLCKAPEDRFPDVVAMADALARSLDPPATPVPSADVTPAAVTSSLSPGRESVVGDPATGLPETAALGPAGLGGVAATPSGTPLWVGAVASSSDALSDPAKRPQPRWLWVAGVGAALVAAAAVTASLEYDSVQPDPPERPTGSTPGAPQATSAADPVMPTPVDQATTRVATDAGVADGTVADGTTPDGTSTDAARDVTIPDPGQPVERPHPERKESTDAPREPNQRPPEPEARAERDASTALRPLF